MNGEAKKLQLIKKLLMVSDAAVLEQVDAVLSRKMQKERESFKNFAGKIEDKDLVELEQIIEQGCGQINPDDWK